MSIFLCWGSFLNVIGYRLIHDVPLLAPRSRCPNCLQKLAWYDLIPVVSWLMLGGRCRSCHASISKLYPFIELVTALSLYALSKTYHDPLLSICYFVFFSLLIISVRTDLETMLVSQYVTLGAVPLGFSAAALGFLPISLKESMLGAGLGFGMLWLIAALFKTLTRKEGMGRGDMELMALIGSFIGPIGVWLSLTIGALGGAVVGISAMILNKMHRSSRIPFGPFLAAGALIYMLFQKNIFNLLFLKI